MSPYFNSGVIIFTRQTLLDILPVWIKFNTLIIQKGMLHPRQFFTDQVSFAIALSALEIAVQYLPPSMNFPTHFSPGLYPEGFHEIYPLIIHHHNRFDSHGCLLSLPFPGVSKQIREINHHIAKSWRQRLNQTRFWDMRYQNHSQLGSGEGSRGNTAIYKAETIQTLLEERSGQIQTVLDIGCGDLESIKGIQFPNYVGVDISGVAIELAQKKGLNARKQQFFAGDFTQLPLLTADLVICFDVLLHIDSYHKYFWAVQKLVELTDVAGIVSGYLSRTADYGIVFYYEPLDKTLKEAGATNIKHIGAYRGIDIFSFGPLLDNSRQVG